MSCWDESGASEYHQNARSRVICLRFGAMIQPSLRCASGGQLLKNARGQRCASRNRTQRTVGSTASTQTRPFPAQLRYPNSGHLFMSVERPVSGVRKRAVADGRLSVREDPEVDAETGLVPSRNRTFVHRRRAGWFRLSSTCSRARARWATAAGRTHARRCCGRAAVPLAAQGLEAALYGQPQAR